MINSTRRFRPVTAGGAQASAPVQAFVPVLALALALATPALAADSDIKRITLSEGQTIVAPIVKENDTDLFLDIGAEIIRVSKSKVVKIESPDAGSPATQPADGTTRSEDVTASDALFSTARLPVNTVKKLADRFGEGVIMVRTPGGLGSGFIIDKRGFAVTNFHVIEGETRLSVVIQRKVGDSYKREVIRDVKIEATNPFLDLALIKFEPPADMEVTVTYLADESEPLRDGDAVFAIGNPLGLERTVSTGIVSKTNRQESGLVYIQTTTQINPGNSGGPLFNNRGEVVGVTNMKLTFGEGLGFAIPVRYVKDFLRNRDAFAYDADSPNSGFIYLQPSERVEPENPGFLVGAGSAEQKKSEPAKPADEPKK